MNIVEIPVSPFSRKLVLARYGATEPIKLTAADTLTGTLCCVKPSDPNKLQKPKEELTATLHFFLNDNLAKHIHRRRWRIGLHLNDVHREKLNEYIETSVLHGSGIKKSIDTFCEKNKIDLETDITFDAVNKDYQRFVKEKTEKNTAIFPRKNTTSVRYFGEKTTPFLAGGNIYTDADLDALVQKYVTDNPTLFQTLRGDTRLKLQKQLEVYVYRTIGKRSPRYIANKFKFLKRYILLNKAKEGKKYTDFDSQIRYSVHAFKVFLKTAPPLSV
jgi:hypothetical protein